jgi:hypothetical protein
VSFSTTIIGLPQCGQSQVGLVSLLSVACGGSLGVQFSARLHCSDTVEIALKRLGEHPKPAIDDHLKSGHM